MWVSFLLRTLWAKSREIRGTYSREEIPEEVPKLFKILSKSAGNRRQQARLMTKTDSHTSLLPLRWSFKQNQHGLFPQLNVYRHCKWKFVLNDTHLRTFEFSAGGASFSSENFKVTWAGLGSSLRCWEPEWHREAYYENNPEPGLWRFNLEKTWLLLRTETINALIVGLWINFWGQD